MSHDLPIFPIDLILYPGARRVMHIFEPRYRDLLADILQGDGCFAIVPPRNDEDAPAKGTIGCVAQIVSHQPLDDGRSNIMIEGTVRCILRHLIDSDTSYLVGSISTFDDEEGTQPLPADLVETLRSLGERCREALHHLAGTPADEGWSEDTGRLTFEVAAGIPWDSESGWKLLAMRSPAERATRLLEVLPRLVPELERKSRVHRRAQTNGHGPQPG